VATQVVVVGSFRDAAGSALSGTITFRPSSPLNDTNSNYLVGTAPIVATLAGGSFTATLYATDDATTVAGDATYTVTEALSGVGGAAIPRTFRCAVPAAAGTLRYEDIVPA
jgi:hypothetical protein